MRGDQRWTAIEFADVCEAVAGELRARAQARTIAPTERLALFEWYEVIKDVVQRLEPSGAAPSLAKADAQLGARGVVRPLRVVAR